MDDNNFRINIETFGGQVNAEQLVTSIKAALPHLCGAKTITVDVEGADKSTAFAVATGLTEGIPLESCEVNRYHSVHIKIRPYR